MPKPPFPRLLRSTTAAALICSGFALVFLLHADVAQRRDRFPPERDLLYLPQPGALRLASLGHTELMADLVWIRQVVYYADQMLKHSGLEWLERYLNAITALDPRFRRVYPWGGVVLIYSGSEVTNAMVRASNEFLEAGLRQFPDDWELNFMLGANYIHELRTSDPKLKTEWRLRGAEHMRRAALTGQGPPWLPVLVATMLQRGGETQAGIRHLEEILLTTEDEAVKEHVRNKLLQLHREAVAEMAQFREDFRRRWHAELRYAPSDLFVLLGDRPRDVATPDLAIPEIMQHWEAALSP